MIGNIAISLAGHDKNKTYIIVKEEKGDLFLADGILKTLEHPKRKKQKHVQINRSYDTGEIKEKLLVGDKIYDHEIKRTIKMYMMQKQNAEV